MKEATCEIESETEDQVKEIALEKFEEDLLSSDLIDIKVTELDQDGAPVGV